VFSEIDHVLMAHALKLAKRGLYTASPNPRVGCVLARDGRIVGEGYHQKTGAPHAEVNALEAAGPLARQATAYVTLEPCKHHGRTPPCVDALIAAGVTRVVAAVQDPNPQVSGAGLAALTQARIQVETGLLEREAYELNIGFFSRWTRGRPWMRMKIAASLDGKTALSGGASQWVTAMPARRDGHRLRARSCAVMTGIGTVQDDDPRLTVREVETSRQPLKVVVDSKLQLPLTARVLQEGRVLVASAISFPGIVKKLEAAGAQIVTFPNPMGKVDLSALLQELARREINEVLVEAGFKLNGSLLRAGLVDELVVYLSPHLIGEAARGMFDIPEIANLSNKREVSLIDVRQVGPDVRITARF
jgi:diaminohydroxyphosphoribosylaminopyrimidine deaminase / 5-amino-6-(5-phosphoribosylamino)uracil reductase